jgi:hypothetical protein
MQWVVTCDVSVLRRCTSGISGVHALSRHKSLPSVLVLLANCSLVQELTHYCRKSFVAGLLSCNHLSMLLLCHQSLFGRYTHSSALNYYQGFPPWLKSHGCVVCSVETEVCFCTAAPKDSSGEATAGERPALSAAMFCSEQSIR